jgi:hypothetical protein
MNKYTPVVIITPLHSGVKMKVAACAAAGSTLNACFNCTLAG